MAAATATKQRVSYFYQPDVGHFYYGPSHPMKPHRITMAHHLILSYGLYRKMECYRSHPASAAEMTAFHSEDYINFLSKITPDNVRLYTNQMQRFNVGEYTDCPVFDGQYEFFQLSSGASIDGAVKLNRGDCDVAINWSGGLHHAKKSEASGFCYVNDIVLAILELLKVHARVLYIDIDVHHGDGVEEAFYCTDRVMTFSLHKYGDFFPGTGHIKDTGAREGTGFSVNAPLTSGITDDAYERLFKPVLDRIMDVYRPGAIVLQCGADSLTGDRLGCFNLSLRGHGECVRYTQSFGVPTLVLGGGGYTIRNVARCWAYETSVLLDTDLPNEIPYNDYFEYYAPDFKLHLTPENRENMNTEASLESVRIDLLTQLMNLRGAPSVQMAEIPPDFEIMKDEAANSEGVERKSTKEYDNQRKGGGGVDEEKGMNDGGINDDRRMDRSMTKDGRGQKREHDAELEG